MKEIEMGKFAEEITVSNAMDSARVEYGVLKEVRQVTLKAVVDTGAMTLCLDEATCQTLGLEITGSRPSYVANGARVETKITTPVGIRWKDRYCTCNARVVPGATHTLLGAIPLEDMDLMADPVHQCLVGIHGDQPLEEID
jgi:clan AA aspartic protease